MIRSELVFRITALNPHLRLREAEAVVDTILDGISDALARGDRVELRGLGTFSTRKTEARQGLNPRNGQPVEVEAKAHVRFRMSKVRKAELNQDPCSLPIAAESRLG